MMQQNIATIFQTLKQTIINENNIDDVSTPIYGTIISNIQKSYGKVLGWIIVSVVITIIICQSTTPYLVALKSNQKT